jgi:predicted transcriptional regulator
MEGIHMKKSDNSPLGRSQVPEQQSTAKEGGVQWLRHAGVGPGRRPGGRNAAGKISGEAVTSLGSLEAEIMGLVWEIGRPVHAMEVAEAALYRRRGQGQEPIAFSTVATTLRRLSEKGLLTVGKKTDVPDSGSRREMRTPYYEPTVGREEMAARILDNVSRTLLGASLHALIPKLTGGLKRGKGDTDEQQRLDRLMQALELAAQTDEPVVESE